MRVNATQWETLDEARQIVSVFPFCAECKTGVKIQHRGGMFILECLSRPMIHSGLSDWNDSTERDSRGPRPK